MIKRWRQWRGERLSRRRADLVLLRFLVSSKMRQADDEAWAEANRVYEDLSRRIELLDRRLRG